MSTLTDTQITASATQDRVAAGLGLLVIAGLYADGWAHVNIGGMDSFFTPWHGLLYGSFVLLTGWIGLMTWRRRRDSSSWLEAVPVGYLGGVAGIATFGLGGFLDMVWHMFFGVETGVDALVSPTHLVLLVGGALLLSSPLRSALSRRREGTSLPWPAVLSTGAVASLAGFFLSYLSVFADPGAVVGLTRLPEGAPGHEAAELPAVAGLAEYLVTTMLLVLPILFLRRSGRLPTGAVTVVVALVAVPAAVLTEMQYVVPLVAALVGAALVDAVAARLSTAWLAAALPGAVWAGQLTGLRVAGDLAWPVELWAGVTVLTMLAGLVVANTTQQALRPADGRTEPPDAA